MILAGDVGASKTSLGLFRAEGGRLVAVDIRRFRNREYGSLDAVLEQYLPVGDDISSVCFGAAGPVMNGKVKVTNLSWDLDSVQLNLRFRNAKVSLINDVEATAYSIDVLALDDLFPLNAGIPDDRAAAALIASGTGLGESILYWRDGVRLPVPSEGGHADFAPADPLQAELLQYLWRRFRHVSWDRVLSGPGLLLIYEFLRDTGRGAERHEIVGRMATEDPSAVISEAGLSGQCELCVAALDTYVAIYGAEAGNLALRALARGGLYLGGGIAPKIRAKLSGGTFMKAFTAKGHMHHFAGTIPVHLILNENAGLLGAARYAALTSPRVSAAGTATG